VNLSLRIEDFTWSFLTTIISWSLLFGALIIALSMLLGASTSFIVSFTIAATIDVGSLWLMSREGHKRVDEGWSTSNYIGTMTVGRVLAKAILLLGAALIPSADLLGVIIGILLVDTTIMVISSIASAWKVIRDSNTGHMAG